MVFLPGQQCMETIAKPLEIYRKSEVFRENLRGSKKYTPGHNKNDKAGPFPFASQEEKKR